MLSTSTESYLRLQEFIRSHNLGGCRLLSVASGLVDECNCLLCDLDRVADMKRTIPARNITICDRCHKSSDKVRFKAGCVLTVNRGAFDHLGDVTANGSHSHDLCDECMMIVEVALDQALKV